MRRRARLSDVARDAGVSPATVSRAIGQPGLVNTATLARVRASAARLGYVPDGAARALASGRSMTIGAVVPTLDSAIFSRALQSMQAELARAGYQLLVAAHDYSAAAEAEAIRTLLLRGIDGLMLVGAERPAETRKLLEDAGIAIVLTWCGDARFASVVVDNAGAGRLAAEHLIEFGHTRIGAVIGRLQFNDRQSARLAGIKAALADAGLDLPDWRVSEQPLSLAGGRMGCAALLELGEPVTAIIGGIDILAIGCIAEAHARGLGVPDALSVAGIDGLEMSAHVSPSLTTVHLPLGRIGEAAARHLLADIASGRSNNPPAPGSSRPDITELPVALVARKSSAPVRAA